MTFPNKAVSLVGVATALVALTCVAQAQDRSITVASTTSIRDSGLYGRIVLAFTKKSGIDVRLISQGTGQALAAGRRGDADVVFADARFLERKFVADGYGVRRYPVMYNDFMVGPKADTAGINGTKDILTALRAIKNKDAPFVSRGDQSGTHITELALWQDAGIDISKDRGRQYKESGQGMGATLNIASASNAYVLTDRATWLSFRNRGDLVIAVENDKRVINQYCVILVNPEKHPHVKKGEGQAFIDWLRSPEGQNLIADYKIDGQQLFFPNANSPAE